MSVNDYTYDAAGLSFTEKEESCALVAYQDPRGIWTIGYGHTGPEVVQGLTITQQQANDYLSQDIQTSSDAVNRLVAVKITQGEFDALVDFVYNVGVGAFENSTLLRMLNAGDFAGAADQLLRWDYAGRVVLAGLLNRRILERQEFLGQ